MLLQADYCCLNEQWPLQDVVAVFSRHYLHQNRAIEVFFSDRSSAFFAFESNREVKTTVRRLPKVGIGTAYDFAQTRCVKILLGIEVGLMMNSYYYIQRKIFFQSDNFLI